jgi:hypothetical protein
MVVGKFENGLLVVEYLVDRSGVDRWGVSVER